MKKHLLAFIALFILYSTQLNSQTCASAKTLSTFFSPSSRIVDTTVKVKSIETWFKIPVKGDSMIFRLNSALSSYRKLTNKVELYSGLSCASLTFLNKDTLTASNDSVLIINVGGLTSGDTLFLKTTSIANVTCPLCPDSALFRMQVASYWTQVAECPDCTTMTGCNFVCNGDFESFNPVLSGNQNNLNNACGWSNLTGGSCDYFNSLCPAGAITDIPCNGVGYEPAYANPGGNIGYGGFAGQPGTSTQGNYAEYMKTKLLSPLVPGNTYTVTLRVSLAEASSYNFDQIGVYFYENPASVAAYTATTTHIPIPATCTVVNTSSVTKNGWTILTVSCSIPSSSPPLEYMAIGAFTSSYTWVGCSGVTGGCTTYNCSSSADKFAYMYVDDITVYGYRLEPPVTINNCPGRPVTLTTTLPAPLQWSNQLGSAPTVTVTPPPMSYLVVSYPSAECRVGQYFNIVNTIVPTETITVTPTSPYVCSPAGTVTLTATGLSSGTYNWQNPGGPIIAPPSPTQTYTYGQNVQSQMIVSGVATNGCPVSKTVNITSVQTPTLTVNSPTVCANVPSVTLTAGTNPAAPVTWSTGQTGSPITITTPTATTVYTVTATGTNSCNSTATSTVTVSPVPSITSAFTLSPAVTCINSPVTADATQVTSPFETYSFTYNFGDPSSPTNIVTNTTGAAATHNYTAPGTYTVTLTATASNIANCSVTSTTTHTVQIVNLPSDMAIEGLQQTTCEAPSSLVSTNIPYNPNYTYSWAVTAGSGVTITPQAQPNSALITMVNPVENVTICLTVSVGNCSVTMCKSSMYCCPGGTGITVLTNPTVSTALAAGNYVVNGTMTVTSASATWNNVNLTMNPFSQIVFSGTNTLNITNSHLHGCTSMWEGIKMMDNSVTLNTTASLIEDAQKGIYVFKRGILNSTGTWFNKNRIGVELDQSVYPVSFTGSCFISCPTPSMATVAAALPSSAYATTYSATLPYNTSSTLSSGNPERGLNIISSGANTVTLTNRNLFQHVFDGIYISTSSQNVYYADFQRVGGIGGAPAGSAGVKVVGINNASGATPFPTMKMVNVGDRNDPTKKCRFNNCLNGVWWTLGAVGDVATNTFTATANDGIHIEEHPKYVNAPAGYSTEKISILGNKITNSMHRGVFVYNFYEQRVRIAQNQLNNSNASYKAATAIEAALFTGTNPSANNLWITDNNGVDAYGQTYSGIGIRGMYNGIRVTGYKQAHITGNLVETYPATAPGTTGGDFASAVYVINNDGTEVANNALRNTTSSAGYAWWLYGIIGESSPNSKIYCNDILDIGVPLQLKGPMPSDVYGNNIQNGLTGLWLAINGFIGDQDNPNYAAGTMPQDNQWGTFLNGAFISGQTLDTYSSGDGSGNFNSTGSRIYYRNGTPTVWYPQFNGFQFPSTAFTTQSITTVIVPPICSPPITLLESLGDGVSNMTQNAALILNEETNFGTNNENAQYILKQELYKNIRPLDALRENNAELADFYNSYTGGSYDKMYVVDSLVSAGDSSKAILAQALNSSISQNTDIEQTQVRLNQLLVNKGLNSSFSEADYAAARSMAMLCPFTHGKAVYQARAILSAVDTTHYISECEIPGMDFMPGGERLLQMLTNKSSISLVLSLYPNPANTLLTLLLRNNEEAVSVGIVNLLGEKQDIKTNKTAPGIVQVDVSTLANGTYLCKIYVNGILQQNEKLVIVK